MRIAVLNWSRRRVGGAETYLATVLVPLARSGHTVSFWSEQQGASDREPVGPSYETGDATASECGDARWLKALRGWRPDLIYSHGLTRPDLEAGVATVAPVVFFAHGYFGTCISGSKTWKAPITLPCSRTFGAACLLHYYPHRCGGWNPRSMWTEFRTQGRRLSLLRGYSTIVTASEHMRREFRQHGIADGRVVTVPLPVYDPARGTPPPPPSRPPPDVGRSRRRLVFAGRMDHLKGGRILLDALPLVAAQLDDMLDVTFLGDGPERPAWEHAAQRLTAARHTITGTFPGGVDSGRRSEIFAGHDLFVMPSLWPEPFGLAGLEAGLSGIPTAAFPVGGIPEWLTDGVNGCLVPGDRASPAALATSVLRALDPALHAKLRLGAFDVARRYTTDRHLEVLLPLLERARP